MSFNTSAHMQAADSAAVDAYLGQFVRRGVDSIMQSEPRCDVFALDAHGVLGRERAVDIAARG